MASTYLERNMTGNTASTKMTFSCWLKISNPSTNGRVFGAQANACHAYFGGNGKLNIDFSAKNSGSVGAKLETNRLFRDTNAWYHIVFALDTTLGTADDRIKFYVNGVQETSFSSRTNPGQNDTYAYGQNGYYTVGARTSNQGSAGHYFDGLMSHVHYCDAYVYSASNFGSTDSTTGEWQINTSPSVTYGTNGFFILKDGNSGTDQSPNTNNFTASGTLTKTEDSPSNVFATLNPLVYSSASKTYGHGNNSITASASGDWCSTQSTIGASSGKYYCEIKINSVGSYQAIGVAYQPNISNTTSTQLIGELTGSAGWRNNGALVHGGSNINTYTTGDILMIAMDLDNQKLYFGKNGAWENSGNPASGATGTGSLKDLTANEFYHFVICPRGGSNYCNFGNGYFGTTAVSSAGTNASGIGIFEYDVPANFTALSTKGLNT